MTSLLNVAPDYQITQTPHGSRRRYSYANGSAFSEWTSRRTLAGRPLLQIANGCSPETGKVVVARGFIAIGQQARGVIAIGQIAIGGVAIGQIAVGGIAIGQIAIGVAALGQVAVGVIAVGMEATGLAAMGMQATGIFVLGWNGVGVMGRALSGWGPSSLHIVKHLFR